MTMPTYVHIGAGWPADKTEHPIVTWFAEYTALFDDKTFERSGGAQGKLAAYHTQDFVYRQGGRATSGPGSESVERIVEQYRVLESHCHEPVHVVVHPSTDPGNAGGYEFLAKANLYVNVAATPTAAAPAQANGDGNGPRQQKQNGGQGSLQTAMARSADGREWDLVVPTMAHFVFAADPEGPNGFRMSYAFVNADELQLSELLVRKGLVTWDQVGVETARVRGQSEAFVVPPSTTA